MGSVDVSTVAVADDAIVATVKAKTIKAKMNRFIGFSPKLAGITDCLLMNLL